MSVMVGEALRRPAIGVDAAVFRYTGNRRIFPGFTNVDVEERNLTVTNAVLDWTYETNEDKDIAIKVGRTTGHTLGTPISAPSAINARQMGSYEVIRRGDQLDLVDYSKRHFDGLWLRNQYLVAHPAGEPFVDVGDEGSVCYLNSSTWDNLSRWKLRPWGLLHARLLSDSYSFGVLSPMDAVLRCFHGRTFSLLAPDNAYRLGNLKETETTNSEP